MKKILNRINQNRVFNAIKPVVSIIILVLILRWTGAISGISYLTQSAMMETGIMDAAPEDGMPGVNTEFDYNFTVYDVDDQAVNFESFKGKTIFLNLWATWCGPCRVEMPSIQKLYEKVDTSKVVFVMLSLDVKENKTKVTRFIEDKKYTFPVYCMGDYLPEVLQRVNSIPTTFVISVDGKILSKKVGAANYDTPKYVEFLNRGNK